MAVEVAEKAGLGTGWKARPVVDLAPLCRHLPVLDPGAVPGGAGGDPPRPPCVLAVTHMGTFEPLFVAYAGRFWRAKALFAVDPRYPFLRFIYGAFWGFEVTTDPERKKWLNPRTLARAVDYLRRGGVVMVFPEGERFWERVLYPGAAVLARRAGVPLVPVGVECGYFYRSGGAAAFSGGPPGIPGDPAGREDRDPLRLPPAPRSRAPGTGGRRSDDAKGGPSLRRLLPAVLWGPPA